MRLMHSHNRQIHHLRTAVAIFAALLVAFAIVTGGCAGGENETERDTAPPQPTASNPASTSDTANEPVPLAASGGLDGQEAALKDGVVSIDEYNAAVEAAASCMEAAGYTVTRFPGQDLRPLRFTYTVPGTDGAPDTAKVQSAQEAFGSCRHTHLDLVETARAKAIGQPAAAVLEDLVGRIEECMADGGAPGQPDYAANGMTYYTAIPRAMTITSPEDAAAYRRCGLEVEAATGYPMPVPGCGPGLNAAELTACFTGAG